MSQSKKYRAINFGEAVAKNLIKDWLANPSFFPKDLTAIASLAGSFASVSLYQVSKTGNVAKWECKLAEEAAIQLVELFIQVRTAPIKL